VTALGNAGGAGGLPKSSTGKVTGLDQSIVVSDGEGTTARLRNLIRIDAELEPGDSGGPLFNAAGQVIGIDTAASVGFEFSTGNEGYAVPINRALAVVKQVLSRRSTSTVHVGPTPFLGVSIAAGRPGLGSGPIIAEVADGTPAARAGLPVGALITRVDGRSVSTRDDFTSLLLLHKPGDTVTLRWIDQTGAIGSAPVKTTSGPPL
jgi:S1-C subfamily serine protease